MRTPPLALSAAAVLILTACGNQATDDGPARHGYDGPLHVTKSAAKHPSAGAAGNVVQCTTWGHGTYFDKRVYDSGATARSADAAMEVASHEGGYDDVTRGWKVARREKTRVLYVIEVDGLRKQAVIVHDGNATKGAGGPGWHIESFARCDDTELGADYVRKNGIEVWNDRDGKVAPAKQIVSYTGHFACDMKGTTELILGEDVYLRRPDRYLAKDAYAPYAEHVQVPADAVDTGFERQGRHLWLSADKRLAYVGDRADAEVWPSLKHRFGCG